MEGMSAADASVCIVKPEKDYRDYRYVKLDNGLMGVLISDDKCDKAACAMDVHVGSCLDPKELPGLAHFLEHMLFLGTQKYPDETEYSQYLQKHGGDSNAFTADDDTCYYYTVAPESFEGALDRFAQFFLPQQPLFTESAAERELHAVDSEHSKNLQSDMWRFHQLLRDSCNPEHPLNRFATGNLKSLRDDPFTLHKIDQKGVREALLKFHAEHYSSHKMAIVMINKMPLDELEKLFRHYFSSVESKAMSQQQQQQDATQTHVLPFRREDLGRLVYVLPVRTTQQIDFEWFLKEQTPLYLSKPAGYCSHVLGHEGKGSLLSRLKAEGLATELVAGSSFEAAGVYGFSVQVTLTPKGSEEQGLIRVGQLLFAFIRMMASSDDAAHATVFDDLMRMSDISFRFRSTPDPGSQVVNIASALHRYPPKDVMSGQSLFYKFEPALIREVLSHFTCENLRCVVVDSSGRYNDMCVSEAPWYGTKHCSQQIPQRWRDAWGSPGSVDLSAPTAMHLPKSNPFLPQDLALRPFNGDTTAARWPERVPCPGYDKRCHIYHKQDTTFALPKAVAYITMHSGYVSSSLEGRMTSLLWTEAVYEALNEYAYEASMAGLNYSLKQNGTGVQLDIGGFNDKLPVLLKAISEKMTAGDFKGDILKLVANITHRQLRNAAYKRQPYLQCMNRLSVAVTTPAHSEIEQFTAMQSLLEGMSLTADDDDMDTPQQQHCGLSNDAAGTSSNGVAAADKADNNKAETEAAALQRIKGTLDGIHNDILNGCFVEALVIGNITADEAGELISTFLKELSVEPSAPPTPVLRKALKLQPDIRQMYRCNGANPDDPNSAICVAIQVGELSVRTSALTDVLANWIGQTFYDDLRTKQQLGYIVASYARIAARSLSLAFLVQSTYSPDELLARIELFLKWLVETAVEGELTEETYALHQQAVVTVKSQKPKRINEEAQRYLAELTIRRFEFDHLDKEIDIIKSTSLSEFREFVREVFTSCPRLAVLIDSRQPHKHIDDTQTKDTHDVMGKYASFGDLTALRRDPSAAFYETPADIDGW
ncbi:unnamed protein product [Vitrella brassicaformis CCMP3155]|uniref:Peptidase M16 N-terminal domain-containing protein n=2 Tax=Vitrella brassicaformis TaxID=1169539 RepID=A0A0G4FW78_VITBC|nr:unnamed protein product [Vitrella brassicaformis CCMP3155]|mmetsp:Transcript_20300/g.49310  ORF Transcript_20300/g.49310 Transcript_20300/m.49310 type:complete len:1050 (+) Transcript_20300:187-3336(+)|eukprot:CEM19450.1 unnamed protein product [Vitrella brassicaformis CCMP3155]